MRSNRGHFLIIGPRVCNLKTSRKSWPVNRLQVSDLIFDPGFKVKYHNHAEEALYFPFIRPRGGNVKTALSRANPLQVSNLKDHLLNFKLFSKISLSSWDLLLMKRD